jgi:hypothetical protein
MVEIAAAMQQFVKLLGSARAQHNAHKRADKVMISHALPPMRYPDQSIATVALTKRDLG